jgi:hypothetical protein
MRGALVGLSVLAVVLGFDARTALANGPLIFQGGPMKNLYVDLIFWGDFTSDDRQSVLTYVSQLANYLNGAGADLGLEPAVHYYGVSGIAPGMWQNDPNAIPVSLLAGQGWQPDDNTFQSIVGPARAGQYGPAYDFYTSVPDPNHIVSQSGLPSQNNRLALVITKGTSTYCADAGDTTLGVCAPITQVGYHWWNNGLLYGAVMFESIDTLSHEVMEAMTDPIPYLNTGYGWMTSGDYFWHDEACDSCSMYVDGISTITVNSPFAAGNIPAVSCNFEIPERHAPMDATLEYGGNGTQPLVLFYLMRNGDIGSVSWSNAGQPASAPYDYGPLASGVTAVGKPSVVYSIAVGGERLFVRGSDSALWMHYNGSWTSLGGIVYGDPRAVVASINGSAVVYIAVLGLDDNLYLQWIINNGSPSGWAGIPSLDGTLFAVPPTLISRTANTLDVFAVSEHGDLKQIPWNTSTGWGAPVSLSNNPSVPFVTTPAALARSATSIEVLGGTVGPGDHGMDETSWNGSSWSAVQGYFQMPDNDTNYGFEGTPAIVSAVPGRVDVFAVSRSGELWWYWSGGYPWPSGFVNNTYGNSQTNLSGGRQPLPLVSSGVTGDPIAVSRGSGSGEMEVFYRTATGGLAHITYKNGGWATTNNHGLYSIATEYALPPYSIQ